MSEPREFSIEIAAQNIELSNNNWYLGPKVRKYIRISLEYAKNEFQPKLTAANAKISELEARLGPDRRYDLHDCIIERDDLKAKYQKAVEALKFYATEFSIEKDGAWIGGPLYKDKLHGNDMFNCGSYAVGGKRARQTLAELGEKDV